MPAGRKKVFITKTTDIITSDKEGVGTIREEGFNEYVFLKGASSVAAGSPVTFDRSFSTTLLATSTTPTGPVAIANAAIVASRWGWFAIRGTRTVKSKASASKNAVVFNDKSTAGQISTDDSSNNVIANFKLASSATSAVGLVNAIFNYPFIMP